MSKVTYRFVGNGQCRLFTLLLILTLGAVTVHGTHGVVDSSIFRKIKEQKIVLPGGESYKLNYLLKNQCSQRYVQMKFGKRRGRVNARGKPNNLYSQLTFLSEAGGTIRIQGKETKKFLCFNKRGKLVLKIHGYKKQCMFREEVNREVYIRLVSVINPRWYVGFRRNGKPLRGWQITNSKKQKCYDFIRNRVTLSPPRTRTDSPLHGIDPNKLLQSIKLNQRGGDR